MSDFAAFASQLSDETARLVFADWLADHDRHDESALLRSGTPVFAFGGRVWQSPALEPGTSQRVPLYRLEGTAIGDLLREHAPGWGTRHNPSFGSPSGSWYTSREVYAAVSDDGTGTIHAECGWPKALTDLPGLVGRIVAACVHQSDMYARFTHGIPASGIESRIAAIGHAVALCTALGQTAAARKCERAAAKLRGMVRRDAAAAKRASREASRAKRLHAKLVAPKLAKAEATADDGTQTQSARYWARQRIAIYARVGYDTVRIGVDLRGTPPAGEVWVRPSRAGKWATSRKDKYGRPLTADEMAAKIAARNAPATATEVAK